jgi:energy-coupling factor transporter ATP-binding protein EcfA2
MNDAIVMRDVVKAFGRTRALDGLDLTVRTGEVHGFLGPNGAGKTTMLALLLGLLRPSAGCARIEGLDVVAIRSRPSSGSGTCRSRCASTGIGRSGRDIGAGGFQVIVPRAESITAMGMPLLPAMGVTTVLNFQPTGDGKAAITGDFVLIDKEVNPVAHTLLQHGIDVTALHNHGLQDTSRLFNMDSWATDDPVKLAQGLRAALDQTNSQKPWRM